MSRRAVGRVKAPSLGDNVAPWHDGISVRQMDKILIDGYGGGVMKRLKKYLANYCMALLAKLSRAKTDIMKLTIDTMQKLAIVGIALGVFQDKNEGIYIAICLLVASYALTIWRA